MKKKNDNISVNPSKAKGKKSTKIIFSKELTIYSVEDFHVEIKAALKKYDQINVEIKEVENLDLTFIQLMQALKGEAKSSKKELSFKVNIDGEQKMLLDNSGFSDFFTN